MSNFVIIFICLSILFLAYYIYCIFTQVSVKKEVEEIIIDVEKEILPETFEERNARLYAIKSKVSDLPFTKIGVTEETSHYLQTFGLDEEIKDLHIDEEEKI